MRTLKACLGIVVIILLMADWSSCSRHTVGGHHAGGNLTRTYHDGHLGSK